MDLTNVSEWGVTGAIVAAALFVAALLALLYVAGRNGKADDAESERAAALLTEPVRTLYVAPNNVIVYHYLREQGINPTTVRIATQPHQIQGFRGRIVLVQGERTHFDYHEGVMDAVLTTVGIGNTTVETVRA